MRANEFFSLYASNNAMKLVFWVYEENYYFWQKIQLICLVVGRPQTYVLDFFESIYPSGLPLESIYPSDLPEIKALRKLLAQKNKSNSFNMQSHAHFRCTIIIWLLYTSHS